MAASEDDEHSRRCHAEGKANLLNMMKADVVEVLKERRKAGRSGGEKEKLRKKSEKGQKTVRK